MITIEQTPLSEFKMARGVMDPHATLAALGIVYSSQDADVGSALLLVRDPQHGEEMPVYLQRDRHGNSYAVGEITNGVWVVGTAAPRDADGRF